VSSTGHYLDPYRRSQRRHGSAFEVTLWANPRSQRLRFEVMTQVCFFAGKRIVDAGCSRGDFAAYLHERDIPYAAYTGIDALCEVIDYAQTRNLPRAHFLCGDFVTEPAMLATGDPQIIAISGSLNTMSDDHVFAVLDAAWSTATESLIFNFLSDRHVPQRLVREDGPARRFDTIRMLDWATGHTPYVVFRQDYFSGGHDATILMRKHGPSADD
jgi:SAM-dependent methyltransferase